MTYPQLSIYTNVKQNKSDQTIPLDQFLEGIRSGLWQDIVHPIRVIDNPEQRKKAKEKAPCVTVAGKFGARSDAGLTKASGFIAIDIDDVDDINETKSLVCADPHVYACFMSISGRGLCLLYRINPSKHRESFQGISEHLYTQFNIIADPTSVNVSRLRFISYDPSMFLNEGALKWTVYPKNKPPKKVEKIVFTQTDFDEIISQIQGRRLNLCENYHEWLRIGFALADRFGEVGRNYFHVVSQFSSKYDGRVADRQYDACMKAGGSKRATIATFYYYCKQAGVEIYSERTKKIAYSASSSKKGGLSPATVVQNLAKFEEITGEDVAEVVQQVMDDNIELQEDGILEQLEIWLRQNYELRRNEITRYIEDSGKPLTKVEFNSIWVKGKKVFDKLSFETLDRLINSNFVPTYNPFLDFIQDNIERGQLKPLRGESSDNPDDPGATEGYATPNIDRIFSCIKTPDPAYLLHFGRKWMVGIISAIHGEHSPLYLVLSGRTQNTGKTQWFRRLLPKDLKAYYAESKLDAGKDDEILMTQKLIIMDDEMGGKSKAESKKLKDLTSKQVFSLREPYGHGNVDLVRLAVLGGTTNDDEIIDDPTGNRRLLPAHVISIDHAAYNSVDKTELFMEAYHLWKSGFKWELSTADIAYLEANTGSFQASVAEAELLLKYFEPGETPITTSEVMSKILQHTGIRVTLKRLGLEMQRYGFQKKPVRTGPYSAGNRWLVTEKSLAGPGTPMMYSQAQPDPFPQLPIQSSLNDFLQ